jgi:hypothetical protein
MTKVNEEIIEMVKAIDAGNAEYILKDQLFQRKVSAYNRFAKENNQEVVNTILEGMKEFAQEFGKQFITPGNAKVGDGVTMHLYSDAHAGTVIKVTKTTVTVQRDEATRDPNWKPKVEPGGFVGHCTNQDEQTYTYERNPNGETVTFRWSSKFEQYRNNQIGYKLSKGRREFYDFNF